LGDACAIWLFQANGGSSSKFLQSAGFGTKLSVRFGFALLLMVVWLSADTIGSGWNISSFDIESKIFEGEKT